MPRHCPWLLYLVFALAATPRAAAAPITFEFVATITTVGTYGNTIGIPDINVGVAPGSTSVTGTFTYELLQSPQFVLPAAGGTIAGYNLTGFTLDLPSLDFMLDDWAVNNEYVSVRDDVNFCCGVNDQFIVAGAEDPDEQNLREYLSVSLGGGNTSTFTSTALPAALDLLAFATRTFYFSYDRIFVDSGGRYMEGTITSLEVVDVEAVPEPATLTLVGLGLAAIARRRRRRRPQ